MIFHEFTSALAVTIIFSLSSVATAQELSVKEGGARAQSVRPALKPSLETQQKPEPEKTQVPVEVVLAQKMDDLGQQIEKLTIELRRLRKETEHNGAAMELMLYEERLSKVESKLDDLTAYKSQLEARELEVQRRMRNIQQELVLRTAGTTLRRDEAEAAIRADLQRILDDIRAQKETNLQRTSDLQGQAEALRKRVEILRRKLEQLETKTDQ